MDPLTFSNASLYSIGDILNLPAAMEFLDDEDFGSTMMMLENAIASSPTSSFCKEDPDSLNLSLTGLSDAFNARDTACTEQHLIGTDGSGHPNGVSSCLSHDEKNRSSGRVGGGDVYIKQENNMPGLSPIMDSFLRESWDDIVNPGSKSASSIVISTTPGRMDSLTPRFFLPSPSPLGGPLLMKSMPIFAPTLPPANLRMISNTSTSPTAVSTKSKGTRRAKQCIAEACTRRAQSKNRCKTHGGGARCQVEGCNKSSQGGGLCRAHGGGKKCRVPGCSKGTQRLGLCYLHGGIRRCIAEGCKKKDRGNGYCISHGGGRRCEADGCSRSVRKGNHCQMHQVLAYDTPFQTTRCQGLYS
ncbi:unnamed protein product [Peronospora effusa]|uniref:WRKY19-like zinc finger domain-containing protein n=1 Tax=Peronospora effusa TaxID=542832 RepID=A0A3M6VE74_9STRA|nr:hypothetical protein DD238_005824 [Peronospora effusa]CAI5709346.1 unnamed protein product [Peronospora effusa]